MSYPPSALNLSIVKKKRIMIRRLILHTETKVKVYLSADDLYNEMIEIARSYEQLAMNSLDDYGRQHYYDQCCAIEALMYFIDAEMHGTFYPHKR